jgi:hypothetical protein
MMQKKMMVPILITVILFSLGGVYAWWIHRWQYEEADRMLENWAWQNSFTVLSKERANPWGTGPGVAHAKNTQVIYRIVVQDAEGKKKTGLVKLGSRTIGVLSNQVEAEWDK